MEGQGYGLASFKKGLRSVTTCDINKATKSAIDIKEHRNYNQLPFRQVLGRSQVDLGGRRTDMAVSADSLSRIDI